MRISRIAIPVVAAVCMLSAAVPAAAQPYPPSSPSLVVSSATVFAGEEVELTGQGFGANEEVVIDVNFGGTGGSGGGGAVEAAPVAEVPAEVVSQRRAQTVTADGLGAFTTTVRLNQVGTAVITATGSSTGRTASVTVTVLEPGTMLPVTSTSRFNLTTMVIAGGAALALGAVLVLLSVLRRRRISGAQV
ncbi:hypothetical protein RB614_27220 [Phytohabitans sp. ZYX-F-186]|uniref:IPT/TIG domain-containing protein n=1 Tax=Phytohabitans maris TaxID=3071409 RepID=A0ABU0ZP97_9ACTN|nr:hypothetical protein [Phytohabitans sp. ZYX-F-186]MDQ7908222.1 hypothetical protein [Phytohabitans sp. ZYX-F-186]